MDFFDPVVRHNVNAKQWSYTSLALEIISMNQKDDYKGSNLLDAWNNKKYQVHHSRFLHLNPYIKLGLIFNSEYPVIKKHFSQVK